MEINTFDDCICAGKKLGFLPEYIAAAHGIKHDLINELQDILNRADTQEKRWKLFRRTPVGSKVQDNTLRAILTNATTQEELWKVYHKARYGSSVQKEVVLALCKHV